MSLYTRIRRKHHQGGGGPLEDIKTSLQAWYDFDDATDSHNSYDLGETGTPTYGDPATLDSSNTCNLPSGLVTVLDAASEITMLIMVQTDAAQTSGDYFFRGQQSRTEIRYLETAAGLACSMYTIDESGNSPDGAMADSTDYLVGVQGEDVGGGSWEVTGIIDGSTWGANSGAKGSSDTLWRYGNGNSAGSSYYWAGIWTRKLTSGELTALVDTTLSYSDLP